MIEWDRQPAIMRFAKIVTGQRQFAKEWPTRIILEPKFYDELVEEMKAYAVIPYGPDEAIPIHPVIMGIQIIKGNKGEFFA